MNTRARHRILAIAAVASVSALALAGCAGNADGAPEGSADEDVTLTVTTFGTFGYDDLYKEYEKAHPNVKIEATNIDTGGNARTDAFTKIAAGSGLSDVVAIEEGWLGAIMDVSDTFVDLRDYGIEDRKADWGRLEVRSGDGCRRPRHRLWHRHRPERHLLQRCRVRGCRPAERPRVRRRVAQRRLGELLQGRRRLHGQDRQGLVRPLRLRRNAMVNQLDEGYYTTDGKLNVEDNAELKERFELLGAATEGGQSAAQTAWTGTAQVVRRRHLRDLRVPGLDARCRAGSGRGPARRRLHRLGLRDVFPGGAANWGGRLPVDPESSQHKEAAAELADWLTQPEQQVKQSAAAGNFPSTIKAQETLAADATPNEFFNDAPTGAILAERAKESSPSSRAPMTR